MNYATDESDYERQEASDDESTGAKSSSARWYAVQVASGCEKKVKADLEQRAQTLDVADKIVQIEIPQTQAIKIRKDGSRLDSKEKVFPGYVLIKLQRWHDPETGEWKIYDQAWQVIKNTSHVINFVGAEQRRDTGRGRGHVKPLPLSSAEVERIFKQTSEQEPVVKIDIGAGDKIIVLSGPLKDFEGEVIEVSPERSKLKALLSIFGRDTPVELEFNQVEKQG